MTNINNHDTVYQLVLKNEACVCRMCEIALRRFFFFFDFFFFRSPFTDERVREIWFHRRNGQVHTTRYTEPTGLNELNTRIKLVLSIYML